jgi:hypothetical protein
MNTETLIGTIEVSYNQQTATLSFTNLIQGYRAARFSGAELKALADLCAETRKRIVAINSQYNIITGTGGDLAVYRSDNGRRMLYFTSDETAALARFLTALS